MKHIMLLAGALALTVGCSHNVAPSEMPHAPPSSDMAVNPYRLPPLPAPEPKLPTLHVMVDNQAPSPVQCGEVSVHVGKLDVDMPHGGSIDVAGVKGETKAYHILLEDVTFSHKETCFR